MSHQPHRKHLAEHEKEKVLERIADLLGRREEILFAFVHGSFTGDGDFADIDLAIYLNEGASDSAVSYEIRLEMELEKILGHPVDVRILNAAPLSFQYQVCRSGIVVLERDKDRRVDYQTLIWKKYFDFAPFRRRYLREVLNLEV